MNQGDIYYVSLDPTFGREQQGRRPVFVLTGRGFNRLTGSPFVASITSGGNFAKVNGFAVSLDGSGMQTTGVIRCDQVPNLDLSARGARYVESAPREVVVAVLTFCEKSLSSTTNTISQMFNSHASS